MNAALDKFVHPRSEVDGIIQDFTYFESSRGEHAHG
jgi:hypothetical protein